MDGWMAICWGNQAIYYHNYLQQIVDPFLNNPNSLSGLWNAEPAECCATVALVMSGVNQRGPLLLLS